MSPVEIILSATGFLLLVVGAFLALVGFLFRRRSRQKEGESLQQRLDRLTKSLSEAARVIDDIDKEIKAREALVSNLETEAAEYDRIVALKKREVEAVAQL